MNVSSTDAAVRLWSAFGLLVITVDFFAVMGQTTVAWFTWVLAGVTLTLAVTGLTRVCPLYGLLHIGTQPHPHL